MQKDKIYEESQKNSAILNVNKKIENIEEAFFLSIE